MNFKKILTITLATLLLVGCGKKNEEALPNVETIDTNSNYDGADFANMSQEETLHNTEVFNYYYQTLAADPSADPSDIYKQVGEKYKMSPSEVEEFVNDYQSYYLNGLDDTSEQP